MPTDTYFRLPEEKREKIRSSIRREFARVPYEDVSINRIVHDAEISRGSFYQYFDGKEDMFRYLLQEYQGFFMRCARQDMEACGGDPFAFTLRLFDRIVELISQYRDELPYLRNLIGNLRFQDFHLLRSVFETGSAEHEKILAETDTRAFRDRSEESVRIAEEILQSALHQSVCRLLCRETEDSPGSERVHLEKTLALIAEGIAEKEVTSC